MELLRICIPLTVILWLLEMAASDPQTVLLNQGCSQFNVTNLSDFSRNVNSSLTELRGQLENGMYFAVAQEATGSDPVYAMVQCRNYMSTRDCISCFTTASSQISTCSAANGARVIYDGCFLRYESNMFYQQSTQMGNVGICGNRTASQQPIFETTVERLLGNLITATPRIDSFFAARNEEVVGVNGNVTAYGVAQCMETIDERGCKECLEVAMANINRCPPDSDGRAVDTGCFLRYSDSPFFPANYTVDLRPFLRTRNTTQRTALIGGVAGGGGLLLLLALILYWVRRSRNNTALPAQDDVEGPPELQGPMTYTYKELNFATTNFSQQNKVGEGGFGEVYKGILKNGRVVAVKKLAIGTSEKVKAEFDTEVKLISNVHHRNLVRLVGCCSKGPELLLVYEFMPNGSLDKHLFGEGQGSLNWKQRYEIILGTAKGIAYLHEEFHACIIHRDIKPSNILLDRDFQPKIADFGLVRLLPEDQTHLSTKFAGTFGYTAPEYAVHGQLSVKVDTYSFGVVVLEIISGLKNTETSLDPTAEFLLKRAWGLYQDNMALEIVDRSLNPEEYNVEEMKRMIEIAFLCTQSSASLRPTMSEVVAMLKTVTSLEPRQPTRPAFVESERRVSYIPQQGSTSTSSSNATNSITQISAR
ncbi:cysteine-rich RLK (RECEPTOR-like protein kinase) 2, ALTERED SEED GERMINATION 6, CYSTEINE-RICH RLK2 [Hibiscus trionum]|uniref:Cysteine-rich RLK (RECEPTOR-like protein kinase) 2, ALTERED SEED GERMINATION 6, CYSTEINE-RICH RLK2 n=1 Tax=Hibiscus trionum TaxID=183268 RepID=A0A9W7HPX8_HIBTR|nr:cysteine-rich RLK (RECEPTOR-like protein kinase) 2, ALTERED SEED GERMINATION 6, CYSTEINE-RICH RLK2 [Hibiscus trionum]